MKKLRLLLPLLMVSISLAFVVPNTTEQKKAIGSIAALPAPLKLAFTPDSSFQPIPEPRAGDWLSMHKEVGQTYQQFLNSLPNRPGRFGRKIIYIQPIGNFPATAPSLDTLTEYMEAYFYPMQVELSPNKLITASDKVRTRNNYGNKQLHAIDVLDLLQKSIDKDAYIVMGVTMTDLYPDDKWNFVFGMARLKSRVGVFSFARYGEDKEIALQRALKVISHETGHAFGMKHCIHYHCIMNGSNGMAETDRSPYHLCPVCLRKIQWGLKFDPTERYKQLIQFFKDHQLAEPQQWYEERSKVISIKP